MALLILLLLLALPFVELAVLVKVAGSIGVLDTIGLLVVVSLVGVWLAKRAGLGVVTRIRRTQADGEVPSRELIDGGLILLAAFLLVLPGFVSDAVGILLLLPPVRIGVRTLVLRRIRSSARIVVIGSGQAPDSGSSSGGDGVWNVDSWEDPPSRDELGGGS
jgi:UPF0716 protein FxsA